MGRFRRAWPSGACRERSRGEPLAVGVPAFPTAVLAGSSGCVGKPVRTRCRSARRVGRTTLRPRRFVSQAGVRSLLGSCRRSHLGRPRCRVTSGPIVRRFDASRVGGLRGEHCPTPPWSLARGVSGSCLGASRARAGGMELVGGDRRSYHGRTAALFGPQVPRLVARREVGNGSAVPCLFTGVAVRPGHELGADGRGERDLVDVDDDP